MYIWEDKFKQDILVEFCSLFDVIKVRGQSTVLKRVNVEPHKKVVPLISG
jgi:hypothetical protein